MQIRDQAGAGWINVRLFGMPEFLRGGTEPIRLAERKSRALLAYLAAHPGVAQSRDRLAELFWPDRVEGAGRASLRQALSSIRKAMGDVADSLLIVSRESVMLTADGVKTDVLSLESAAGDVEKAVDIAWIGAEFMEGLSGLSAGMDHWISRERARLTVLCSGLLKQRAERAEAEHRLSDAANLLCQAIVIDPLDEGLHRRLMRILAASGRSDAALRDFETLSGTLQTDLGVKPEPETARLAHEIRAGRLRRGDMPPASQGETAPRQPAPFAPVTRYAKSGDLSIAFQVTGSGPIDIIFVTGWVSNLDYAWKYPSYARFLKRLGALCRLIRLDKRGTGLSDRGVGYPTLEERMEDVHAVMEAAGSERAVLFGTSEGGNMCMLFAATYPERTTGLILYGSFAKGLWSADYPWAKTVEQVEEELAEIERAWGGAFDLSNGAPSLAADADATNWFAEYMRHSASPQDAISLWRWNTEIDVRGILPAIRVPTLILHRTGDRWVNVEEGRYLARQIPQARFVEFPGDDHIVWAGDPEGILAEVAKFAHAQQTFDRTETVLATLLVASMDGEMADGEMADGDAMARVKAEISCHGGMVQPSSDGQIVVAFDGPTRAIQCGAKLVSSGHARAAVHIGECERFGESLRGGALTIAAALLESVAPGKLLASKIVKDLTAGAQVDWGDRRDVVLSGELGHCMAYPVVSPK